ncbi:MAG: CcmD family protein [Saprospirales bacterium]|nr:MAG: CcmD family protein [Saprospirales bacterium]
MNLLFAIYQILLNYILFNTTVNPVNDFMRSIGKIWVVVASLLIIFIAIVLFLFLVERKLSKIEKELEDE